MMVSHFYAPHVGGIETVVRHQASGLVSRGWQVDIHTSRTPAETPSFEQSGAIGIHRHRAANPFEKRLRLPVPIPMPKTSSELRVAAANADLVVIHGHVYPIGVLAGRAADAARTPYVVVQHSPWVDYPWPLSSVERVADRTIGRRLLEGAVRVVCVSKFTEAFVASIAPRARTVVVPNGVDTSVFSRIDGDGPCGNNRQQVVTVRRLVPRAGVDLLIDAWRLADLDNLGSLVIGGRGPESERLKQRAHGLRHVEFPGFVPDADLPSLYRGAAVAVMPTRSGEGFGLMAAEALACGTPVVVTAQGALPEVVRNGIDGIVVPEGDARALGAAIRNVLTEPTLARTLREGAQTSNWSWDTSVDRLDHVLSAVPRT
jgi:D-inositol-3-phosphate glycosyltransferase